MKLLALHMWVRRDEDKARNQNHQARETKGYGLRQSRIYGSVPAFKQAESDNASKTLTWMAVIMMTLILGTAFLAYKIHAHPVGEAETLVSAMTRHVLGGRGLLLRAG